MEFRDLSRLQSALKQLDDNQIWAPIYLEPSIQEQFNQIVDIVEESKTWPAKRNHEKGKIFERLLGIVFRRFQIGSVESDFEAGDNQIDHEFKFMDLYTTNFVQQVGSTIVCECKNEKSPVNVTYVSKLVELCETRKSKLGIFFSIVGLTGKGWIFAEGKRKKNFLKHEIAIISFTFDEIKQLSKVGSTNFYSLLKRKYQQLIDEVDEDLDDIKNYPKEDLYSYGSRLKSNIYFLKEEKIISEDCYQNALQQIENKYIKGT